MYIRWETVYPKHNQTLRSRAVCVRAFVHFKLSHKRKQNNTEMCSESMESDVVQSHHWKDLIKRDHSNRRYSVSGVWGQKEETQMWACGSCYTCEHILSTNEQSFWIKCWLRSTLCCEYCVYNDAQGVFLCLYAFYRSMRLIHFTAQSEAIKSSAIHQSLDF